MNFDWAEWGPPLVVIAVGVVSALVSLRNAGQGADEEQYGEQMSAKSRREDLEHLRDQRLDAFLCLLLRGEIRRRLAEHLGIPAPQDGRVSGNVDLGHDLDAARGRVALELDEVVARPARRALQAPSKRPWPGGCPS